MALPAKLLLGGVGLGAAGTGLGIEKLVSSGSKNSSFSTKSKSAGNFIPVKKDCRLHELIAIAKGEFKLITKEELKRRMASGGDFDSIEKACLANAGKDIFVSNRGGWGYHEQDQNSSEHRNKFNQYLEKLNSKQ